MTSIDNSHRSPMQILELPTHALSSRRLSSRPGASQKGRDISTQIDERVQLDGCLGARNGAHGKSERHRSMVAESKAYTASAMSPGGRLVGVEGARLVNEDLGEGRRIPFNRGARWHQRVYCEVTAPQRRPM